MPTVRPKIVAEDEYVSQAAYTLNINLPTSGKVSTLFLIVAAERGDSVSSNNPFINNLISSISVNQAGTSHLNSARPQAFQADYSYKTGLWPRTGLERWDDPARIREIVPIMFGDKINDPNYYVDLGKLSDPQLSVTYDLATTDPVEETIWDTTYYPRFTVVANLLTGPDMVAPKGYHSLRQIESWSPANDEIRKIELKGQRPIKRIYYEGVSYYLQYAMKQYVDRFRIYGDNEEWIPFDLKANHYINLVHSMFGMFTANAGISRITHQKTLDMMLEEAFKWHFEDIHYSNAYMVRIAGYSGRGITPYQMDMSTGSSVDASVIGGDWEVKGLAPWGVWAFDMLKLLGMDVLDPQEHKPIYFEVDHTDDAATTAAAYQYASLLDLVTQI